MDMFKKRLRDLALFFRFDYLIIMTCGCSLISSQEIQLGVMVKLKENT